ncbi:MAG: pyruvate kinase alpha/beta domain-containing protein [Syntrophomonas sp.]|nr:pyruvate kinase alpha/beta domain-containing protein [Syntrophomonas sp.]
MYWDTAGPANTEKTIQLAIDRAIELGIGHIVVASNSGANINRILEKNTNLNIIGVTHHIGFAEPGGDEMSTPMREELHAKGIKLLTTTHLFGGVDRAVRLQFGGLYPAEIISHTLRIFGQGVKVAVEIAIMALDAGLIPYGEDVISIGGTATGADAAIVIRPAHSNKVFQTTVQEIICMPRSKSIAK